MVNGLGNLLSFVDTNVSSNSSSYNLNNYSYDDSFANMLNKTQTEDIYSAPSSVSNKTVERYTDTDKAYAENNYSSYDDYNTSSIEDKLSSEENTVKVADNSSNNAEEKSKLTNAEEKAARNKADESKTLTEDNKQNAEEKIVKSSEAENISAKEKLAITKEKAKLVLNTSNDKKLAFEKANLKEADIKDVNTKENILAKADKKENAKNTEEIEKIKKQIESLNLEELDEDDKKELDELIESLETLKAMIEGSNEDDKKEVLAEDIKDDIEVKDLDSSDNKEIKIASNKENSKDIELKDINNSAEEIKTDNTVLADASIEMNAENKYADRYDKDSSEVKNNNSAVNNTISDDKGAELTIINMKDSADSANLKGYNHYNNNVSKTHNSTNLTDNIIKFQDLMGKLVEKAQVAVNNGKSEVLMSLNPEYLGKVRLKITMDGDNLIGKIFVDNADVKDIFTRNLDTVITSLSEIGINIEGFDVMLRQDMPNDGGFGEELQNAGTRLGFENTDNVEEVKADIKAYIVPERKLNLLI